MKYVWVERVRIAEDWPPDEEALSLPDLKKHLRHLRSPHRKLFRARDKFGKMKWAKDWSLGTSFADRLKEVDAAATPRDDVIHGIAYGLYRWLSGVVHGSPGSFIECMTYTRFGLRPKSQAEPTPAATLLATGVMLLGLLTFASQDLVFSYSMTTELARFRNRLLKGAGFTSEQTK